MIRSLHTAFLALRMVFARCKQDVIPGEVEISAATPSHSETVQSMEGPGGLAAWINAELLEVLRAVFRILPGAIPDQ